MADNLGYTEGTGKVIRSRDRSGVHAQVLSLDIGGITELILVSGQATKANSIPIVRASDDDPYKLWVEEQVGILKVVDFSASQTGQTIWTPTGGKKWVITDYEISFSSAGDITIFEDTDTAATRVCKWYGQTRGGVVHAFRKPRQAATADKILKYTSGAGVAGSLMVWGYEV